MNFDQYQQLALRTAKHTDFSTEGLSATALGVAGEAGEYADLIKKQCYHGRVPDPDASLKELGDVLWYVAVAAHQWGATLDDVAVKNIEKLRLRFGDSYSDLSALYRSDVPQSLFDAPLPSTGVKDADEYTNAMLLNWDRLKQSVTTPRAGFIFGFEAGESQGFKVGLRQGALSATLVCATIATLGAVFWHFLPH